MLQKLTIPVGSLKKREPSIKQKVNIKIRLILKFMMPQPGKQTINCNTLIDQYRRK